MNENTFFSILNPLLNTVKKLENNSANKKMSIDSSNLISTIVLSKSPEFTEIERKFSENEKKPLSKSEQTSTKDSSEIFSSNYRNKRSYVKKTNERVKRWTKEETILYQNFVDKYKEIMKDSSSKRNSKIFLQMSKFIGSKTPSQCRSHHQKFYHSENKEKDNIQKKKREFKIRKDNNENNSKK